MKIVYLLQSISHPDQRYIGIADSLQDRLADHNAGRSSHTARYKPWKVMVAIQFEEDAKAFALERYLKFGSGHAFAKRHFW